MEFIVLLIIVIVMYLILRFIFDFNVKKIKELGDIEEDDLPTAQMLSAFRKLLRKFNYTSNNVISKIRRHRQNKWIK